MIENFWVLTKGGVLLFNKNYIKLKQSDELIAGFFSAMDSFIKETTDGEIKSIILKGKKINYIIGDNLILVLNTAENDNDLLIQNLLKKIKLKFLEKYREELINFSGNCTPFKSFESDLVEFVLDSDISIKCQTCKKIIVSEFRVKQLADNNIYFCCPLCEESFSYDKFIEEKIRVRMEDMILYCSLCKIVRPLPMHCNKPMHPETVKGKEMLVCWMGLDCNVIDIPRHCETTMIIKEK